MGYGDYSAESRSNRSFSEGYTDRTKSVHQVFKQREMYPLMNPKGVKFREAVDSEDHPNTIPIIFGLDETGSMGSIPRAFIADGLPTVMSTLIQGGLKDATMLFIGIGDHEYDYAPLQVGQFESSDELLDKWLSNIWIEGKGGGNAGESYFLAHYFAAYHTKTDAWDKRKQKGFLFTVGDEPTLKSIPSSILSEIMGDAFQSGKSFTAEGCIVAAQEMYHVFHFHISETTSGRARSTVEDWKELLGQNLIEVDDYHKIPQLMIQIILSNTKNPAERTAPKTPKTSPEAPSIPSSEDEVL